MLFNEYVAFKTKCARPLQTRASKVFIGTGHPMSKSQSRVDRVIPRATQANIARTKRKKKSDMNLSSLSLPYDFLPLAKRSQERGGNLPLSYFIRCSFPPSYQDRLRVKASFSSISISAISPRVTLGGGETICIVIQCSYSRNVRQK